MMSSLTVPDGLLHRSREEIVGNCQKDTHFQKKIKNNFNQSDEWAIKHSQTQTEAKKACSAVFSFSVKKYSPFLKQLKPAAATLISLPAAFVVFNEIVTHT